MTTVTTTMHITMDSHFDLHAAGLPIDEADALYAAWADAIAALADGLGVGIATAHVVAGSPEDLPTRTLDIDDEVMETTIWQAAHDAVARDSETGVWTVDAERASEAGRRLRARLR